LNIEQYELTKKEATDKYNEYKTVLKDKRDQFSSDMKAVYYYMRHGHKIIDVFVAIPKAGINKDGDPNLAIARADMAHVNLTRERNGTAIFKMNDTWWRPPVKDDVILPPDSFKWNEDTDFNHGKRAPLPNIPAKFMPKYQLRNYHILWEVDKWENLPPRDPILLKRITPNMFVSLAAWNLTDLEFAVIKGRHRVG
jgi:hypothetical protein